LFGFIVFWELFKKTKRFSLNTSVLCRS